MAADAWVSPGPRIGVLGASGLVGGGFVRIAPGAIGLGRHALGSRRVDLDAPIDPAAFAGLDLLVHAAGPRDEDVRDDAAAALRRAERGTAALVRAALAAGVRGIVSLSTAHVYGALAGRIDETQPRAPMTDYARAHAIAEDVLMAHVRGSESRLLIVRPNAVFGTSYDPERFQRWWLVPFAFPIAALSGAIRVGQPAATRNFVSTETIARQALQRVAELAPGEGSVLHPIGGDTTTIGAFAAVCAEEVRELTGKPVRVELADVPPPPAFVYASRHVAPSPPGALREFVREFLRERRTALAACIAPGAGNGGTQ